MTDYAEDAEAAALKIQKKGEPAVLSRFVYGDYDTDTATKPLLSETNHPCFVLALDYDLQDSGTSTEKGSLIQVGDKQILLPAFGLPFVPAPGDLVTVDGETWNVKNVKKIKKSATPILYDLNGRR